MSNISHTDDQKIEVINALRIGVFNDDRVFIRSTVVATLHVPIGDDVQYIPIRSIRPGHFAVAMNGTLIPNVGYRWTISYHTRTYKDAAKPLPHSTDDVTQSFDDSWADW